MTKFIQYSEDKYYRADNDKFEVGDSKDKTKCFPQLKAIKWANDSNFSLRLKSDNYGNNFNNTEWTYSYENDVVTMASDLLTLKFYEVDDKRFEEGSPEFEVILNKKPEGYDVNKPYKLTFSIKTKNLNFYKQTSFVGQEFPEFEGIETTITDTQISDNGGNILASQPDWNVGSYAVYHNSKSNNEYKTGKAFHIPNQKIGGKWNNIEIDIENELMTFTINADLSNIEYPIGHLTGATLGTTTAGVSTSAMNTFGYGQVYTADANGTATSISYYINTAGTTNDIKLMLYAVGATWVLMDWAENLNFPAGAHWETANLDDSDSIASGSNYGMLGRANYDGTNGTNVYYDTTDTRTTYYSSTAYTSMPADPASVSTTTSRRYSMYITYTPSSTVLNKMVMVL